MEAWTVTEEELSVVSKSQRVIVDEDCLFQLLGPTYRNQACDQPISVVSTYIGATLTLRWQCVSGHQGSWSSSKRCRSKTGYPFFLNNMLLASSLFLSGNLFSKVALLCKFLNLRMISASTYYRMQKLYLCPSVNEQWTETRAAVHNEIGDQPVVLLGDGRSDSPGFSAKYCTYSLMDNATSKIIEVQFVDKREVHLKSPCMEKVGLQRSLSAVRELNVLELVTDASISITSMMGWIIVK